ncbi:MAG: hypothetical protein AB1324_06695 [Candidatus Micrarchaeota archaeon]
MVVTQRTEEFEGLRFTPPQAQLINELSTKFGVDPAQMARAAAQMRDIARAAGADFDFMLRVMRDTTRTGTGGFLYSVPHTDTRTVTLAHDILSSAYGVFSEAGRRTQPVFSAETLAQAAEFFMRGPLSTGTMPYQIGPKTMTWLERQAERNRINPAALSNAVLGYCTMISVNPELAGQYLRIASGGDARIESFARMFQERSQPTVMEDGRTSFWLSTPDAVRVAGDFRREHILGSRISRTA